MITNFEGFNKDNWKVGDILVAIKNRYSSRGHWVKEGVKYKIIDIEDNKHSFLKDRIKIKDLITDVKFLDWFFKDFFISLEEWEIKNDIKKYNI